MLQKRLLAAMDLVRPGSRVADIGTDHAYLPIELVKQGISPVAIAADVREGPLRMAQRNIERAGLGARIETVLSDGLTEIAESRYDDLVICGMGGDTIVQILEAAELKNPEKRLILQPQSVSDRLRAYLYRSGYEILCERFIWDMGKLYLLLCAQFTGKPDCLLYTSYNVTSEEGDTLIPAISDVVMETDLEAGELRIRPLEGLFSDEI